jgi:hypothetical protein
MFEKVPIQTNSVFKYLTETLTPEEKEAIRKYTGIHAYRMNDELRRTGKVHPHHDYIHSALQGLLKRLSKFSSPVSASRIIVLPHDQLQEFLENIKRNGGYKEKNAYTSYTMNKNKTPHFVHDSNGKYIYGHDSIPVILENELNHGIPLLGNVEVSHPEHGRNLSLIGPYEEELLTRDADIKVHKMEENGKVEHVRPNGQKLVLNAVPIIHGRQV